MVMNTSAHASVCILCRQKLGD